jgi:dienelactone hydrolase
VRSFVQLLSVLALLPSLSSLAVALDVAMRDVQFAHADVQLSGTLFSPVTPGLFPAMVLMPGSGAETRAPLVDMARIFASQGMVTLVYDKQGVGKSAGDWTRESLDDLAGDALAALQLLNTLPNVDAHRLGAWGISQSGWVLPRLAIKNPDIAFIICITGGGATPRQVEYFRYRNEMLHGGLSEADWEAASKLVDQYMQYLATGHDRDALLKAIERAEGQKWASIVNLRRVMPADADRAKWSWVTLYDPAADIQILRMPVLVFAGGRDPFVPSNMAVQRWVEDLAIAGNPHDMVISYPSAGHGIRMNGHDMHTAPIYAPGYLEEQFKWLREIGVLK